MAFNGQYGTVVQSVANASRKNKPVNTKKVYRPKMMKFRQFCDSLFGKVDNPRFVTEEKGIWLCFIPGLSC